jgi:uncharacterized membrane protein (UPF0136 family)
VDVGVDMGVDMGVDVGVDVGVDMGMDVGVDMGVDMGTMILLGTVILLCTPTTKKIPVSITTINPPAPLHLKGAVFGVIKK